MAASGVSGCAGKTLDEALRRAARAHLPVPALPPGVRANLPEEKVGDGRKRRERLEGDAPAGEVRRQRILGEDKIGRECRAYIGQPVADVDRAASREALELLDLAICASGAVAALEWKVSSRAVAREAQLVRIQWQLRKRLTGQNLTHQAREIVAHDHQFDLLAFRPADDRFEIRIDRKVGHEVQQILFAYAKTLDLALKAPLGRNFTAGPCVFPALPVVGDREPFDNAIQDVSL